MNKPLVIREASAFVYRCPLETPVETSFGTMSDRPMVVVRVTDEDGHHGWGEIWCNFPMVGAEHRARLVSSVFRPLLLQQRYESPQHAFDHLQASTRVLMLQCAEPGPFAQCLAGIDLALWDLCARRERQPLWRYLGGASDRISVYASGLNPTEPERLARKMADQGFTRFKLKIGFGSQRDRTNLLALRDTLGDDASLMVDVNQGWDLQLAREQLPALEDLNLKWIEEPLLSTAPWQEWKALAELTDIPLAAGENLMGEERFQQGIDSGALAIVQPDAAKWGGISRGLPLAKMIMQAGLGYFPHYLGGGVGLLASGHLLAAAGGEGALEIDSNPNPLRGDLAGPLGQIERGTAQLGESPGIGSLDGLESLTSYLVKEF